MSSHSVISVRTLGKRYELGETFSSNTLRDAVTAGARRLLARSTVRAPKHAREFWALRDVSFDVAEGDVLGIIGANGAGKSTLLKVLSQITEPTQGEVKLRGRVASLLEVGTGFHPELSGRENVFMNGAILGMSQAEIRRKFDEIVAFAGVEQFVDTPVKRYSSGMLVRLGFGVAAHLEPEILIVDEVLAVGDFEFQKKCLGKMNDVARAGRTVLFVSHNMAAVHALCTRAVLLDRGRLVTDGSVDDIVEAYQLRAMDIQPPMQDLARHPGRVKNVEPYLQSVSVLDETGSPASMIPMGTRLSCMVGHKPLLADARPSLGAVFKDIVGGPVLWVSNRSRFEARPPCETDNALTFTIDRCPLMPGRYSIDLYFGDVHGDFDVVRDAVSFEVVTGPAVGMGSLPSAAAAGSVWQPATWTYQCHG